jgi:hypothetical protein
MDKKAFDRFSEERLIKTADQPTPGVEADRKVKLNRRGNELFNQGDIEAARRIFQTTGYSDGLIRIGEKYQAAGKPIDALKMYTLAKDKKRSESIIELAAAVIHSVIKEQQEEVK